MSFESKETYELTKQTVESLKQELGRFPTENELLRDIGEKLISNTVPPSLMNEKGLERLREYGLIIIERVDLVYACRNTGV